MTRNKEDILANMIIGENLFYLRRATKRTLIEVAEHLLISRSTLTSYENGERAVPSTVLCRMARYYNISVCEIFKNTETINK